MSLVCSYSVGVFTDSLSPALDAFGLDGVFRIKEKQHEGLATFYRRSGLPAASLKKMSSVFCFFKRCLMQSCAVHFDRVVFPGAQE